MVNPSFSSNFDMVEPLNLQCLAAPLRQKGFTIEILDCVSQFLDSKKATQAIPDRDHKVLGITIPFQNMLSPALALIDDLRSKGVKAHITIGGHPPTFAYREILSKHLSVDSVVRGEGEYTLLELTKKVCNNRDWTDTDGLAYRNNNQIVTNLPRPLIKNLDELPWPARDVLKNTSDLIPALSIASSRGCYHNCSFCSISAFYHLFPGPSWRARKAEPLVDEIQYCVNELNINKLFFVDDNFIGPGNIGRKRAYAIAEEILKRNLKIDFSIGCRSDNVEKDLFALLKKSGLSTVFIGTAIFDIMNKVLGSAEIEKDFSAEINNKISMKVNEHLNQLRKQISDVKNLIDSISTPGKYLK